MTPQHDFTLGAYGRYLTLALDAGYEFFTFEEFDSGSPLPPQGILLRHDIDFSPTHVAPMADVEHRYGVVATYCFQPDSMNYRIDDDNTIQAVNHILRLGHVLGLHFDASGIGPDEAVVERVTAEANRLQERFGAPVHTVSFHMPGRRPVGHLKLEAGLVNTYGPRFFEEIGYVSDSNQNWRGRDLEALLTARTYRHLQVLIHPMWWREHSATMLEKLEELARHRGVGIDALLTPEQRSLLDSPQ